MEECPAVVRWSGLRPVEILRTDLVSTQRKEDHRVIMIADYTSNCKGNNTKINTENKITDALLSWVDTNISI